MTRSFAECCPLDTTQRILIALANRRSEADLWWIPLEIIRDYLHSNGDFSSSLVWFFRTAFWWTLNTNFSRTFHQRTHADPARVCWPSQSGGTKFKARKRSIRSTKLNAFGFAPIFKNSLKFSRMISKVEVSSLIRMRRILLNRRGDSLSSDGWPELVKAVEINGGQ